MKFLSFLILLVSVTSFSLKGQDTAARIKLITDNINNASDLYVSSQGIYILHTSENKLSKINENGEELWTIGGKGSGSYQFDHPVDVHGANGMKIYVTDRNNNRVSVFDRRGQFLSTIEASDDFGYRQRYQPFLITVNKFGEVFFIDTITREVRHFDLDGNTLLGFPLPDEIKEPVNMISVGNQLYIFDHKTELVEGIHLVSEGGNYRNFRATNMLKNWTTDGQNEVGVTVENDLFLDTDLVRTRNLSLPYDGLITDIQWFNERIYVLQKNRLFRIEFTQ
ncbi:hypothetical protein AB2B38_003670 [Balneola sp. MJW-20]|uniref:hypothetical protein n=1 Tax=Gracilimonas aurantiaca TaxID=3234185 RepID=UPI003466D5D4